MAVILKKEYNYKERLATWQKFATRNEEVTACDMRTSKKCRKNNARKTLMLSDGRQVCWFCWISKLNKNFDVVKKPKPVTTTKAPTEKPKEVKKVVESKPKVEKVKKVPVAKPAEAKKSVAKKSTIKKTKSSTSKPKNKMVVKPLEPQPLQKLSEVSTKDLTVKTHDEETLIPTKEKQKSKHRRKLNLFTYKIYVD